MIITKLQVAPVELDVSSQSSSTCRTSRARRVERVELCSSTSSTQPNAWARHVECVESSRVEPSGIWALLTNSWHLRLKHVWALPCITVPYKLSCYYYQIIVVSIVFNCLNIFDVRMIYRVHHQVCCWIPHVGAESVVRPGNGCRANVRAAANHLVRCSRGWDLSDGGGRG